MKQENVPSFAQDSTDFWGFGTTFLRQHRAIGIQFAAVRLTPASPCRMINSCNPYAAGIDSDHDNEF
jgi:hypothetical protein